MANANTKSFKNSIGVTEAFGLDVKRIKYNLLRFVTDKGRSAGSIGFSSLLARSADTPMANLNEKTRRVLELYGIDADKWEVIRQFPQETPDARYKLITPEGLDDIIHIHSSMITSPVVTDGR